MSHESISKRYYHIDGEMIWDEGGMKQFLTNQLSSYCEVSGFKLEVAEVFEDLDKSIANYSVVVNDTTYIILDNYKVLGSEVWRIVPLNIARMINKELAKQGLPDRMHLIHADNDCACIFLTDQQYKYLFELVENKWWKAYSTEEWKDIFCKLD